MAGYDNFIARFFCSEKNQTLTLTNHLLIISRDAAFVANIAA